MPCAELGPPSLPTLPSPFSLAPPAVVFPTPSVGVSVCCITKTFSLSPIPLPPIPWPNTAAVTAFLTALNAAEAVVQAWADEYLVLSIPCPRE